MKTINFMGQRKLAFAFSAIVLVAATFVFERRDFR